MMCPRRGDDAVQYGVLVVASVGEMRLDATVPLDAIDVG